MSSSSNHNPAPLPRTPLLVALTGGIGCGKTTVLKEFRNLGIPCFIADDIAGAYYQEPSFLNQIRSADKQAISRIVFSNPQSLQQLNQLIHPRVWSDFLLFAASHPQAPYLIFESAIVYEYAFDKLVDKVICVYLDYEERMSRLMQRDRATRAQLQLRMNNQLSAEEKMMRADYVILNYEGNPRPRQVRHIHSQLLETAVSQTSH